MSYKPIDKMTDDELRREARVWDAAVRDSQVAEWVDCADQWRNKIYAALERRKGAKAEGR